jgi:hypothetical protein
MTSDVGAKTAGRTHPGRDADECGVHPVDLSHGVDFIARFIAYGAWSLGRSGLTEGRTHVAEDNGSVVGSATWTAADRVW